MHSENQIEFQCMAFTQNMPQSPGKSIEECVHVWHHHPHNQTSQTKKGVDCNAIAEHLQAFIMNIWGYTLWLGLPKWCVCLQRNCSNLRNSSARAYSRISKVQFYTIPTSNPWAWIGAFRLKQKVISSNACTIYGTHRNLGHDRAYHIWHTSQSKCSIAKFLSRDRMTGAFQNTQIP